MQLAPSHYEQNTGILPLKTLYLSASPAKELDITQFDQVIPLFSIITVSFFMPCDQRRKICKTDKYHQIFSLHDTT
ncbi:hypothetical protein [Anaerobiospirillum sp. NML120511]|uniref:hypothetical protein n=1 Tax=Anaerobiospirillum sp. NML120511 TaxID=2932819 RepID=UPI001FF24E64|nr:hypothetical protein [Anaerobiospirillum sp. NML120511]MCK0534616.1 hypothetical protein [Anaerobiospirillum sp. NML120511]